MTPPPVDDAGDSDDQHTASTESDRAADAIEPPTRTDTASETTQPPAASDPAERTPPTGPTTQPATDTTQPASETRASVDSKWWYAVAAVPLYVLVGIVGGVFAVVLFLFGVAVDVGGGMGLATGFVMLLLMVGVAGYALAGLALSILFPAGIYLDAKAVATSDADWDPDAVLYLLVAAASVVLSAFTLSAVVALYYLYRRNSAVGVP